MSDARAYIVRTSQWNTQELNRLKMMHSGISGPRGMGMCFTCSTSLPLAAGDPTDSVEDCGYPFDCVNVASVQPTSRTSAPQWSIPIVGQNSVQPIAVTDCWKFIQVLLCQKYRNRLTFDKVIAKTKNVQFFETQCRFLLVANYDQHSEWRRFRDIGYHNDFIQVSWRWFSEANVGYRRR